VCVCVCDAHRWGNGGVFFLAVVRGILVKCRSLRCDAGVVGKHRKDTATGQHYKMIFMYFHSHL